jgi:ABC-type uncharacterized transport system permease subunit
VSEIAIFSLYLVAAAAFALSRIPRFHDLSQPLSLAASLTVLVGIVLHADALYGAVVTAAGFNLSLHNTASMIGLELALIGLIAALEPALRGMSAGLMALGAFAASLTQTGSDPAMAVPLSWQIQAHILVSLFSYGLLTVGAIVALYGLVQERRLRAGQLKTSNYFFAPLETTEKLLFGIAWAGFMGLLLAIVSGMTFVEDLFAQHLVHKTAFSILALCVFAVLLAGRHFAGWRGARAIKLYLGGFMLLCLAYFGSRIVLEQLLQRSWS